MYSLPNEYAIDRSNVETIQLVKEENGEKEVVVSQYITGFALLNDRYVYLQTARNYTNDEDTSTVIVLYYLVDSETDAVTGPFTLDNRDVILENIGVTEAPTLIQTGSMPKTGRQSINFFNDLFVFCCYLNKRLTKF